MIVAQRTLGLLPLLIKIHHIKFNSLENKTITRCLVADSILIMDFHATSMKFFCTSTDSTVRNELMKEFTRFGEPSIKLVYDKNTRLAYLYFSNYEDAREARHTKSRLILLDKPVIIDPIYDRVSISRKRSISPEYARNSLRNMSPPLQRRLPMNRNLNHDRYQLSVCIFVVVTFSHY